MEAGALLVVVGQGLLLPKPELKDVDTGAKCPDISHSGFPYYLGAACPTSRSWKDPRELRPHDRNSDSSSNSVNCQAWVSRQATITAKAKLLLHKPTAESTVRTWTVCPFQKCFANGEAFFNFSFLASLRLLSAVKASNSLSRVL